tara:strand:+ start:1125 stop:1382 length:258 start_codon:yes stop_codon:yes gene_type:complete
MRKHTKIYLNAMGYTDTDYIPCEICSRKAVDIHHIEARGMGGSKAADTIENLQAVCRHCHLAYGDKKQYKQMLINVHNARIKERE